MLTELMFKFFILIYLFAISSYSQTVIRKVIVKPVIEQVQQEEEDISQIEQEIEEENPIPSGVTVDSCGLNRIDAKTYDNKIIGGGGYYKTKKLFLKNSKISSDNKLYKTAGIEKMNNRIEK
jgi:hypothetical protein